MANALLTALADAVPAAEAGTLPAWYRERQARAWAAVQAAGWPSRGAEAWKYTSLHALAQRSPVTSSRPDVTAASPALVGARFVDGHAAAIGGVEGLDGVELESLAQALARDDKRLRFAMAGDAVDDRLFARINAARAIDGAWLRVAADADVEPWLTLACTGLAQAYDNAWHLSHRIDLGEGARLRLIVDLQGGATPSFATMATRIRIQRGAHLHLVWLNAGNDAFSLFADTQIDLDADARLSLQVVDAGAAPSRHDLGVALRGERALANLGGVFLLDARRHADLQLDLRHLAGHAGSETVWRTLADDRSRAVFNGYITVAPGADGTDARLTCKSLLGSARAEVDARPVLEIHADDVKCAHGATVGQLDQQALFYLRSRGIPQTQARALLQRAFAIEAFAHEPDSPASTHLAALLGREVAG